MHSSRFAAEWWNNIWERHIFRGFLDFAWHCKESGDDDFGWEAQRLFSKLTCCMRCICKWIWTFLVQLRFSWMCMSFVNTNKPNCFFCQTAFCIFLEAAWCFSIISWTRRTFLEFVMSWKLFENVLEMVMNSTNMNSSMWRWVFLVRLESVRFRCRFSRRDKCKKTNIAQCILHDQQTYFALFVSCVEKSRATCAVRTVVWGLCFVF